MELTAEIRQRRSKWVHTGSARPPFAVEPRPGQRSVWDFPRPPRLEPIALPVRVEFGGRVVAETDGAFAVLETASPPTVYVPPTDVVLAALAPSARTTVCEWKGLALHFDLAVGDRRATEAAWVYDDPFEEFAAIESYVSFHPARVDRCRIGEELVEPQPGAYYGGWVTADLVGPFKGGPGTSDW